VNRYCNCFQTNSGLIGVFDGLGGAGGATYPGADGTSHTGAFYASRLARSVVSSFFESLKTERIDFNLSETPIKLRATVKEAFANKIAELDTTASKIKSNLIRRLPTTMATIYFEKLKEDERKPDNVHSPSAIHSVFSTQSQSPPKATYRCNIMWAGDSRCFLLNASRALQQLTEDDLKTKGDALTNLSEDSVELYQC
jgi:serine/threonine protein phosphatase PrpC